MFERLAKFRGVAQWLKVLLGEATYSHPVYCNDNRPGFRRPDAQGLRPHQVLACHWLRTPDGTRLECRWSLVAGDQSVDDLGRPIHVISSPLVPNAGRLSWREGIAS